MQRGDDVDRSVLTESRDYMSVG